MNAKEVEYLLDGKRVLITGASRGIGLVVAERLAVLGSRLILISRNADALKRIRAELAGGPHEVIAMDVRDDDAWADLRNGVLATPVQGVVTAAAGLGPIGAIGTWSACDFRSTLESNLLGTLLAIDACLPGLTASRGSIVTFSGGGATKPFPLFDAYAVSKAAVVRLTENLALELVEQGVRVNSVAPGFIATGMHEETIAAGPSAAGQEYYDRTKKGLSGGGDNPEIAAELTAFLLSDASEGITGKLISAPWDPWKDPAFQDRLRSEPDLATLRRIDDQFFASKTTQ